MFDGKPRDRSAGRWRWRLFPALLLISLLPGCGGDGSGTPTPAATATRQDATTEYRTQARDAAAKLGEQAEILVKDMQAAELSQADPKWPAVLTADADLVLAAATALKALTPPPGTPAELPAQLAAAADRLSEGADLQQQAVQTGDRNIGQQAFVTLAEGRTMLNAAAASLQ